jgi:hypothetical protein
MARLPNEIVLPGAVAWNLVALAGRRGLGASGPANNQIEGSLPVNSSRVWTAYREGKTIYIIEPALVRLPGALALAGPHTYRGAPVAIALPSAGAAVEGGNYLPRGGLTTW